MWHMDDPTELFESLRERVSEVELALRRTIFDLRVEHDAMRKVTGPPCPKCGHFLKAEHYPGDGDMMHRPVTLWCSHADDPVSEHCPCRLGEIELIATDPEIAAEMGLVTP
jgi:hypothetical protein